MAKCEVTTTTKQVMTTVEEKQYILILDQEEAELIKSFLGICSGKFPTSGEIFRELYNAGVKSRYILVEPERTGHHETTLEYIYLIGLGDYT